MLSRPNHTVRKSRNIAGQNRSPIFLIYCANNAVEHYEKRIKIMHGCPIRFGRKNLETYFAPFIFLDFRIVCNALFHELRTPGEEIAFTARPKIHSHSQIFWYGRRIFCLPQRPKFLDFFDFCLHWVWVSVVRALFHVQCHCFLLT